MTNELTIYKSLSPKDKDKLHSSFKRGRPIVFSGPPGCGKTMLVNEYAILYELFLKERKLDRKIHVTHISLNKDSNIESLYGSSHKDKNGYSTFLPGILLHRLEDVIFNFDEASRCPGYIFSPLLGLTGIDRTDPTLFLLSLPGLTCNVYMGWSSAIRDPERGVTNFKYYSSDDDYSKVQTEGGTYFIKHGTNGQILEYIFLFKNTWLLTFTLNNEDRDVLSNLSEAVNRRIDHLRLSAPDVSHIRKQGPVIFEAMFERLYLKYNDLVSKRVWDNDYLYTSDIIRKPTELEKDELIKVLVTIMRACNKNEEYNREIAPYLREGCIGIGYGLLMPFIENYLTSDRTLLITDEECFQKAYEVTLEHFLEDDLHYYPKNLECVKSILINSIRQCVGLDDVTFIKEDDSLSNG